jgi:predicted  nucleic acid-binding Zn-ribbon protein
MVEAVALPVLGEVLRQVSERIAKKLMEGKKLTDTEVIILLLDQMNRALDQMSRRIDDLGDSLNKRIDDVRDSLGKRIDETNKRIDDTNAKMETVHQDLKNDIRLLYQEVSSVKSVVINLLKEMLEKR